MIDLFVDKKSKEVELQIKKLGFSEILFCKTIENIKDIDKEDAKKFDCYVIKTNDLEQLRRCIDKSVNVLKKLVVLGTSDEINRIALESKKTLGLLNPEIGRQKDYSSYRNSGLNHVLCKIARDNNKMIFISIDELNELKDPVVLGRVIQNIKLCNKFKAKWQFVNLASDVDGIKSAFELKEIERVLLKEEHFEHEML